MKITSNPIIRKAFGRCSSFFATAFLTLLSTGLLASGGKEGEKFNAGEMIVHHISDAHSIHFFGNVTVPLPCIVKTDKGFDFFMSSVFMDDHHEFSKSYTSSSTGNTYVLHHEKIYVVDGIHDAHAHADHTSPESHIDPATAPVQPEHADSTIMQTQGAINAAAEVEPTHEEEFHGTPVLDFSITKSVLGMLLMLTLVVVLFVRMAKAYEKRKGQAPKGMQNALEPLVLFIKDEVAIPALGKKRAQKFCLSCLHHSFSFGLATSLACCLSPVDLISLEL